MTEPFRPVRSARAARTPAASVRGAAAAGLALAAAALAAAAPVLAQDGPARELTVGLSTGLAGNTNRRLEADGGSGSVAATAGLSFAFRDATPLQSITVTGDTGLRYSRGSDADEDANGFTDPSIGFAYQRAVPDTAFAASGSLRRSQVDFLEPIDAFLLDPDDPLFDPEDLTRSLQEGTRLSFSLQADAEFRRTAPFGFDLSAGVSGTRYDDLTGSDLVDTDRTRVGVGLRFQLDPVTLARVGLNHSTIETDDGTEARDTSSVTGSISREFPLGQVGLQASYSDTEEGQRTRLSATAARQSVTWDLSGSLGLAQDSNDDLTVVGGLRAQREFEASQVGLAVDRSVRTGDDAEITVTALSADYGRSLTPTTSLATDAAWVRTTDSDDTADAIRLGLSLNRSLTEDWSLSTGVTHRIKDNSSGRAQDTALTLGLRREFSFIP
ncbi:hypothetical protein [Jannaschia sp. W003]|uniref:hypothetical protein n=1 Tax=Jannaschia sp. W003 TaxID=2867012 RepID=UPI0021A64F98|nr:hypothetical protein [Jannaschia sp. W003]UWQ23208.1 hypothetical protein K3554_16595 [Jannaschia sp. W003]